MYTVMNSVVHPFEREKNRRAICRFLASSYEQARDQFQTGISFIRDEFADMQAKAGRLVNRINHFLKDPAQLDREMSPAQKQSQSFYILLDGKWVSGPDLLEGPLEENY